MAMRNLTAQELAAIEIIRRGDEAVTGIQGTFNGEDAIFIVQVSPVEGSEELRIYPLAMLLRDEDMPFVGGPHEEQPVGPEHAGWPDQTAASRPEAWPDEAVVSPPAPAWPDEVIVLPPEGAPPAEGREPPTPPSMSAVAPGRAGPLSAALGGTARVAQLEDPAPSPPDAVAERAARQAEETRIAEETARRAEEAARRAEAARVAEETARRAEEMRAAEETARRAEETRLAEDTARRDAEALVAEDAAVPAEEAPVTSRPTRRDIVRERREAAQGEPGTTGRRRAWPTLDLSVRTSRILLAVGRTLIAFGTLMLLFVAYELWGTNIAEARSQRELKREFAQIVTATTTPPGTTPETTSTVPAAPVPQGEAVALIEIPKIGVNKAVVAGVGVPDLKKGPGHYPGTPLPGEAGNAAIAGHRTTYGAPFNRLDELNRGDQIVVTTRTGRFTYEVDTSIVVKPTEVAVLNPTTDNRLTLTTCNPKYSARQRLIVVSHLVGEPPAPPPVAAGEPARPAPRPTAPDAGLSGESAARRPTLVWGAIVAGVAFLIWLLGRLWRRWPVYLVGTPVFLVVLFIFFENVSRLLPANV